MPKVSNLIFRMHVVIIGGGIIGLATALNIVEARKNVHLVLIEKEKSID